MHECVFTDRLQQKLGVHTINIAKRLLDYGFHPPTIYFPQGLKAQTRLPNRIWKGGELLSLLMKPARVDLYRSSHT